MSAADKAALVNTVYGTSLYTRTASGTERVVDGREIVLNGDSAVGTGLLTLHTADTAVGAILAHRCALIVVGAFNDNARGVVEKVDDAVGTLTNADAAADTLLGINACNAVLNSDSILRTYRNAVAVAKTSIGTGLVAAVCHICGKAGFYTAYELVLSFNHAAGTVAGYEGNLFYNVCRLNAEDSGDLLSGTVTAGNTEVGLVGGLFCKSLCIAVTSAEAARTAVCTGEAVTDSYRGLVLLDTEEHTRKSEKDRTYYCNTQKKKGRNKNR